MEDLGRVSVNNVKTMVLGVAFDLIFLSQIISLFSGGEQKKRHGYLVGGFKHFLFSSLLGEMIQFDYRIFFKWVETTN